MFFNNFFRVTELLKKAGAYYKMFFLDKCHMFRLVISKVLCKLDDGKIQSIVSLIINITASRLGGISIVKFSFLKHLMQINSYSSRFGRFK